MCNPWGLTGTGGAPVTGDGPGPTALDRFPGMRVGYQNALHAAPVSSPPTERQGRTGRPMGRTEGAPYDMRAGWTVTSPGQTLRAVQGPTRFPAVSGESDKRIGVMAFGRDPPGRWRRRTPAPESGRARPLLHSPLGLHEFDSGRRGPAVERRTRGTNAGAPPIHSARLEAPEPPP